MTPTEQIKEKCLQLQDALLANNPRMPVLLREIHQQLKADPEIVTLLNEEDISMIVNGLKRQTQTEIATAAISKSTKKKPITLADL